MNSSRLREKIARLSSYSEDICSKIHGFLSSSDIHYFQSPVFHHLNKFCIKDWLMFSILIKKRNLKETKNPYSVQVCST